jgi:ribosome-associated protein YbcJ (S4-like RNA binding protein)
MKSRQPQPPLKFKEGQIVEYILAGAVIFKGKITEAKRTKLYKPYTIKTDSGEMQFAHEQYLRLAK